MNFRSLRTTSSPKLMIIPMIDIIFFLLVFFMMSSLTMVTQKSMPVQLPMAQTAAVDVHKKIPITVMADGKLFVEDKAMNLEGMVRYLQIEQQRGADIIIVLRADTKAEYGNFVQVLDTLKQMHITRIAIATDSK